MNLKHFLVFATFILLSTSAFASHLVGGSIRYTNVTNANTPTGYNEYYVEIELLRDPTGITLPYSLNVICNRRPLGNYTTTNFTFQKIGTYTTLTQGCGATGSVESYIYADTVLLVEYGAYDFSWSDCCRNANIDNLATPASEGNVVIGTIVSGKPARNYNNSPSFYNSLKSFPVGTATFPICTADPDGDSTFIQLFTPHDSGTHSANTTAVDYASGYSSTNPFGAAAAYSIDQDARTITITSSVQQICAIAVRVSEYVKDTAGVWRYYGSIERDEQYYITAPLSSTAIDTLEILDAYTPTGKPSDSIIVDLNFNAYPNMFDVDSVQMTLTHGTSNAYVQSVGILANFDQLLLRTDTVLVPGNWTLHVGTSSDSISLYSQCGSVLDDTFSLKVNVPIDTNYILGPDSAYTGQQHQYYLFNTDYVDSVSYSITNGFWWNPTNNPNDTIEITWTVQTGEIVAELFLSDTVVVLNKQITINGIGLDEGLLNHLVVAPNPATDFVEILGLEESAEYRLINAQGLILAKGQISSGQPLEVSKLPAGQYTLHITNKRMNQGMLLLKQ